MRILVVEDELDISSFLESFLTAQCFVVDIASDGAKGSFLAKTNQYDLIILDNILPSKSGKEICQEIREQNITVPIIMLSVKSDIATKVDLLDSGADDYLVKPFSPKELLARIKALLRRPKEIEHEVIVIGDLLVNINTQRVFRGEREVYLTRKEFSLLEYMARNRGIVLSRGMIMEHVWDMNADPFSNTIESHILSLRKKIGDKQSRNLIETVPRRGYRIIAS